MTDFKPDANDITMVITPVGGKRRLVICAACKFPSGHIVTSARHFDKGMHNTLLQMKIKTKPNEQGFIDQWGNFMTRQEAALIVGCNGQQLRNPNYGKRLYSEDLY